MSPLTCRSMFATTGIDPVMPRFTSKLMDVASARASPPVTSVFKASMLSVTEPVRLTVTPRRETVGIGRSNTFTVPPPAIIASAVMGICAPRSVTVSVEPEERSVSRFDPPAAWGIPPASPVAAFAVTMAPFVSKSTPTSVELPRRRASNSSPTPTPATCAIPEVSTALLPAVAKSEIAETLRASTDASRLMDASPRFADTPSPTGVSRSSSDWTLLYEPGADPLAE